MPNAEPNSTKLKADSELVERKTRAEFSNMRTKLAKRTVSANMRTESARRAKLATRDELIRMPSDQSEPASTQKNW